MIFLFVIFCIFPSIYGAPDKFVGLETEVYKHEADIAFILQNIEVLSARMDQLLDPIVNGSSSDMRGKKGETRVYGEKGTSGETGNPGEPGEPGLPGPKGEDGMPGYPGVKGERGSDGIPGMPGSLGPDGLRGDPGRQGDVGPIGPPGPPGLPGPDGRSGYDGRPGPQGDRGEVGFPGLPGSIVDDKGYCILAVGDCPPTFEKIEEYQAHVDQYQFGNHTLMKNGATGEDEEQIVLKVTTCCR